MCSDTASGLRASSVPPTASHGAEGFSLVELLMVVSLTVILATMAVGVAASMIAQSRADSSIVSALNGVKRGLSLAVAERRNFDLRFIAPNQIQIARVNVPAPGTTTVIDVVLDNGMEYVKFSGVPDTPDMFGGSGAIAFNSPTITFTSEATLVDSNGDVINGTVFMGLPGDVSTARAITILGATGLVRPWRWNGTQWIE